MKLKIHSKCLKLFCILKNYTLYYKWIKRCVLILPGKRVQMLVRLFPKGISLAMMASMEKSVARWHVCGFVAAWGDRDFSFSVCIASSEINIGMTSLADFRKEDLGWWVRSTNKSMKKVFQRRVYLINNNSSSFSIQKYVILLIFIFKFLN